MQSFKNRMDVVRFLSFTHKPCCCILNFFEVCLVSTEGNLKAKSYSSLSERGQESIQGFGLLRPWRSKGDMSVYIKGHVSIYKG